MRQHAWEDVPHDVHRDVSAEIGGLMQNLELHFDRKCIGGAYTVRSDGEVDGVDWDQDTLYFPLAPPRKVSTLMTRKTERSLLTDMSSEELNYGVHDMLFDHQASPDDTYLATTSIYRYKKGRRGISRDYEVASYLLLRGGMAVVKLGQFESIGIVMAGSGDTRVEYSDEGRYSELDEQDERRVRAAVAQLLWPVLQSRD
ncbi:hypothetical protein GII36_01760 [Candidatus Mycosynbacter amalyticus]|uniref:Uncharacterized protein n=1 Tax=Candidatus Mycosynbacter amalyticus TaxID=2665156 RepID=A0A857MJ27_9BACT|nr:hypothetical protein [Candidatus Mycosynbacter amalyticus]QHN42574.1 hypothetical protein GII36_01760 [Candidatus Mycosynbacter amalyticus]